ncbi:MAG TPA: S-layer homology domain-containing protein [Symbiobacteriaceae bacterium]|nr:S-layer homology domain-containing protein [Symbiobacteriaceae bacterium]
MLTWKEYASSGLTPRYYIFRFTENDMLIELQTGPGVDDTVSTLNPTIVSASERFTFDKPVPLSDLGKYLSQATKLLKDPMGVVFTSDGYNLPIGENDQLAFTVAVAVPTQKVLVGLVLEYGSDINIVDGRYDVKGSTRVRQVYVGKLDNFIYELYKNRSQPDRQKVRAALLSIPDPVVSDRLEAARKRQAAAKLKDIGTHWAREAIADLVAAGIVSGYPDDTFRPDLAISRAAFVKLLVAARKLPIGVSTAPFSDVVGHWSEPYVSAAIKAGIVSPGDYANARFDPDKDITRGEIAVMVARAAGLSPLTERAKAYTDYDELPVTAVGMIGAVSDRGIVTGYPDGTFGADQSATRAQAVVIISRMLKLNR